MISTIKKQLPKMSIKYSCKYCIKEFTRKNDHKKHEYVCDILNTSKRDDTCIEEETTNIPSHLQLYKIILEMGKKINKLEQVQEDNKKWIDKIKNKINILSILNSSIIVDTVIFLDWIKELLVTEDNMHIFMNEGFTNACIKIIMDNLNIIKNKELLPIKCVEYKKNIFYIYSFGMWKKMDKDEFIILLKNIHKKIFKQMCDWKKINIEKFNRNDKMEEIYGKNIIKLMSIVEFNNEVLINNIKGCLHKNII